MHMYLVFSAGFYRAWFGSAWAESGQDVMDGGMHRWAV